MFAEAHIRAHYFTSLDGPNVIPTQPSYYVAGEEAQAVHRPHKLMEKDLKFDETVEHFEHLSVSGTSSDFYVSGTATVMDTTVSSELPVPVQLQEALELFRTLKKHLSQLTIGSFDSHVWQSAVDLGPIFVHGRIHAMEWI